MLELAMFLAGQTLGGGVATGIFVVSAAVRLATLPLTYRIARRARERRARVHHHHADEGPRAPAVRPRRP